MNKKFSTLVASLLLVAGSGAYTPVYADAIDVSSPSVVVSSITPTVVPAYSETSKTGGYQVGKSYFLGNAVTPATTPATYNFLYVESNSKVLKYGQHISNLTQSEQALWTLTVINAPEGAVAPQYTFVNKATGVVLAMDPSKAIALSDLANGDAAELGGNQTEWLQAPSYRNPAENTTTPVAHPIYAAAASDNVITFALKTDGTVVLVKTTKASLADATVTSILKVTPYVVGTSNNVFTLSPKELNTMLGKAGENATKDNFFSLGFSPVATVNGEKNIWADDLQAVAVEQFELKWGEDASKKFTDVRVADAFASLYPATDAADDASFESHVKKDANDPRFLANETGYNDDDPQWVALRNREGKFLVVDTVYITGTAQANSPRITFTYDDLYNARTETRFRNPQSYLFRFDYNPVTGTVEIQSKAYISPLDDAIEEADAFGKDVTEEDYYGAYDKQAKKLGSKWVEETPTDPTATPSNRITDENYIVKAALGSVTEVTLGEKATEAPYNTFSITLGNAAAYVPTIKANTAYLLKIAGSKDKSKIGKYVIDNLKGSQETMEQAKRQNFQDMPAAQWILTSPTVTAGAPVTLTNREFLNTYITNATMFAVEGQSGQAFFMGGDTLEFIPVTDLNNKYLGYKYVADDTIKERTFVFNYLHELTMDRSINTVDNKDSVVWVDANGGATNFVLEKVLDDAYGTNMGISSIAKLERRVYKIKVNDASKLENDKRYLKYDENKKKYIVSTDADNATKFFLKENNEVDGGECYYTLVEANVLDLVGLEDDAFDSTNGKFTVNKTTEGGKMVADNDAVKMFVAEEGKVLNPETGLNDKKALVVKVFADPSAASKYLEDNKLYSVAYSFEKTSEDKYAILLGASSSYVDNSDGSKTYYTYSYNMASSYAKSKVSVDNNTLNLVNGVIYDNSTQEVANSAFAVVVNNDPLYRRFNTELEGLATDAPDTVKFYRVNATEKEFLYEDATSKYSKDKEFNFLGVEDKGVIGKNASIFVDTAYVRGNTNMPQYLLAVRPNIVPAETILCDATTHAHTTEADRLACPHTSIKKGYIDAWYLVNLQDSVDVNEGLDAAKYQWNNAYTRLGFVEARHIDDTLVIKNSIYTGNNNPIEIGKAATWAGKDSIFLGDNTHKNVAFSFRLVKSGSNDFLIESEGDKIAPEKGGWVKIQNGVPVIAKYETYNEAGRDAEIFNVEKTSEIPTANESIEASEVNVTAAAGAVIVKNAAGKKVAISNILGQTIATVVLTSDNETIAVPAGIVVVAVEGEDAVKTVVK